ncbi:hypothetical protein UFOVP588_54 [uncultured Caudovirales phage]|uniref:Uncharacterized protein n=1 Tax=uncultured Caudovirales phage TaxID=2100421 RepID=A0A6J5MY21_9CAUD|nr:hypothetical protein UFOVP588_54 [uncultured Caudovirales phage]
MSSVVISGDTSGAITVSAPVVAGTNTLTLQAGTGTNSMNTLATAVASTSGTSIDFTGIPAWVKRITVMFQGVSTTGISPTIIQLGYSGGFTGATYNSSGSSATSGVSSVTTTVGLYAISAPGGGGSGAAYAMNGMMTLANLTGNTWASMCIVGQNSVAHTNWSGGIGTAGGTLTQIRITTVGGTETFDAGSINILYEG